MYDYDTKIKPEILLSLSKSFVEGRKYLRNQRAEILPLLIGMWCLNNTPNLLYYICYTTILRTEKNS